MDNNIQAGCRRYHSYHETYETFKQRQRSRPVESRERSGRTRTVCGLYLMIMSVFGTVLPIGDALSKTEGVHTYYTQIFHSIVYFLSVGIFTYFMFYLLRQRVIDEGIPEYKKPPRPKRGDVILSVKGKSESVPSGCNTLDGSQQTTAGEPPAFELWQRREPTDKDHGTSSAEGRECNGNECPAPEGKEQATTSHSESLEPSSVGVTLDSEGLNVYLRLGAVGFGLGSMVHCGFRISEPFENPAALQCRSYLFFVNAALYLLLVFMQTFFIFKYHKIIINKHKPFVRLCLVHLIATNLAVWLSTTVNETVEDIGRVFAEERGSGSNRSRRSANASNTTTSGNLEINCHEIHTLSDASSPYLFPCIIEYSLIAAAVAYKTNRNVGRRVIPGEKKESPVETFEHVECHKANLGLFAGLIMILLTFVSIGLFFVFQDFKDLEEVSSVIFLVSEIALFSFGIIASAVGMIKTRKLYYIGPTTGGFDDKLLLVALFGNFLLNTCVGLSSASHLTTGKLVSPEKHSQMISAVFFVMSVLNVVESTTQSVFILDGLRRRANHKSDIERKPGRSMITFLLVCNLAMWMINTFEMKKYKGAAIHVNFYNYLPWSTIMHLCLPLVILFRFHSSVCLAEIWHKAYIMVKKE